MIVFGYIRVLNIDRTDKEIEIFEIFAELRSPTQQFRVTPQLRKARRLDDNILPACADKSLHCSFDPGIGF